ncbi:peptidase M15 [Thalassotalea litorea]|uniref:D-alanyl-D-alanine dipeptidase n=1 Tax=Thalassotalea litorea TaxID=2020715 RepID=A0A5R9IQL2_9GAMM|nr:M15 family metallopeptidase [Thalassotalea litorea]TLU67572.1 peptidase M15 [Thalassotalea litorea]
MVKRRQAMIKWPLWLLALFAGSQCFANEAGKQQFVDIKTELESVEYDIRYAGYNNFVGEPVDGYLESKCFIHRDALPALKAIVNELANKQMTLKFFDCYRPEKAVAHFMRWAKDLTDLKTKAQYYPNLPKSALVGPYIAEKSGHSRGFTIDVTLVELDPHGQYQALDMGSPYDMFDAISNTESPNINAQQKANRELLKNLMQKHGFAAYDMEWWHFTYANMTEVQKQQYYDFDVQ